MCARLLYALIRHYLNMRLPSTLNERLLRSSYNFRFKLSIRTDKHNSFSMVTDRSAHQFLHPLGAPRDWLGADRLAVVAMTAGAAANAGGPTAWGGSSRYQDRFVHTFRVNNPVKTEAMNAGRGKK